MHDPEVHRIFFQHLRTVDTSVITIGSAPLTTVKQAAIADQAPVAIRFLVHAIRESRTKAFCRGSKHMSEGDRMNYMDDIDSFELKHRSYDTSAFQNLLGDQLQEALLLEDFKNRNSRSKVYQTHAYDIVQTHFAGQRYQNANHSVYMKSFKKLGLETNKTTRILGSPRRCIWFPSIEGLQYMLSKKHWLGDEDE